MQGAAQRAHDHQARSERQPHQEAECGGAWRLLQRRSVTGAVVEWRRGQRGGGLERHVGVVLVVASLRHRTVIVKVATDGRARQECWLELATSSSPRPRGPAGGPPSRGAQRDGRPRVTESPAPPSRPPEAVGGEIGSSPPTFRWFRLPRLGLPAEAPVAGEVDRLGIDAECAVGGRFQHRPRRL
jgi:hypothetical protein